LIASYYASKTRSMMLQKYNIFSDSTYLAGISTMSRYNYVESSNTISL